MPKDDARKILISDLHLCTAASLAKPNAYGWLAEAAARRLAGFLTWVGGAQANCDELILLGDVVDLWVYPHDVDQPSLDEILSAPQNAPVLEALHGLISAGIHVTYIRGNHDMHVTQPLCAGLPPQDGPYSPYPGLRVEHGHATGLFNAADPRYLRPAGYYLSRISASYQHLTGQPFPSAGGLISDNPKELLRITDTSVAEAALDAARAKVVKDTSVEIDGFAMTDPPTKVPYAKIATDFLSCNPQVNVVNGVLSEIDPYMGLDITPGQIVVCGHSHRHAFKAEYDGDNRALYINTGAWCRDGETYFASIWKGQDPTGRVALKGRLSSWDSKRKREVCNPKDDVVTLP